MKTSAVAIPLALLLFLAGPVRSQDKDPKEKDPKEKDPKVEKPGLRLDIRYGFVSDLRSYPQTTPKEALQSIVKAVIDEQVDYMMAHLADPEYVDGKVQQYVKIFFPRDDLGFSVAIGRIGIVVTAPDEALLKMLDPAKVDFNLVTHALMIETVQPDSPAARAGLKEKDILWKIGDKVVSRVPADLLKHMDFLRADVKVDIHFLRDGKKLVRKIVLPDFDGPKAIFAFRQLVKETTSLFFEDAARLQELRRFAKDAEWSIEGDRAVGTLKHLGTTKQVFLRREENRWFLENRQIKEK